jgi:hypothetical protein
MMTQSMPHVNQTAWLSALGDEYLILPVLYFVQQFAQIQPN